MRARTVIAVSAAALVLGVSVAACSPAPSPRAEALAYMRAHPVSPAGMTAGTVPGIILTSDARWFLGAAAAAAGCPATLTASIRETVGNLPGCGAWEATAITPDGQVVPLWCGSISARQACPLLLRSDGYMPWPGDYVLFRPYTPVAVPGDVRVVAKFAVEDLMPTSDPTGSIWVTSPAGST